MCRTTGRAPAPSPSSSSSISPPYPPPHQYLPLVHELDDTVGRRCIPASGLPDAPSLFLLPCPLVAERTPVAHDTFTLSVRASVFCPRVSCSTINEFSVGMHCSQTQSTLLGTLFPPGNNNGRVHTCLDVLSIRRYVAMKLDVNVLRYLGKDDFRTLTAVEMGQVRGTLLTPIPSPRTPSSPRYPHPFVPHAAPPSRKTTRLFLRSWWSRSPS